MSVSRLKCCDDFEKPIYMAKADCASQEFVEARTMLSKQPIKLDKVPKKTLDMEILRLSIVAEMDAINLYEQMAETTEDPDVRAVLLDIAKEEKTHAGEFQAMLLRFDKQQEAELQKGRKEVEELTAKKQTRIG